MLIRLKSLSALTINSVAVFSVTTAVAQSATYFIVLFYAGLAEAGQFALYVAISGVTSALIRPQFWMYLGLKDVDDYQRQLYQDSTIQKLATIILLPPVLALTTSLSALTIGCVTFYSATYNCNFVNYKIRFEHKYGSVVQLNFVSVIVKVVIITLWTGAPHLMVLAFLALDAALWSTLYLYFMPKKQQKINSHLGNISRPWKKNYIWGWLQGLSELPISSLDRLILGAMSLELLGVFAFIKQINSLFGMLNTYYANKLFSHLRTHGSSHLTPRAWPDQKALAIAAIIGGLTLSILYSYRLSTLNEVFIPHTEIITIFVLWSCITVSFYHVHIGTNLNGLTKEAFFIHILANSGYFAIVLLATFTERPLAYAVTALIAQQLLIILMKQRVLYLWYRKAN